ncbi:MAG: hypothetical protein H7255_00020, partial [Ramlibacter sp.]|nr:hypothetical protein [Ramlibacter sp.]
MLYRPTIPPFPQQRLSPTGMATAGAIHVALLWLLLQYSPIQQTIRYVVYQYVQPVSPASNNASRAITLRPPVVISNSESPTIFSKNVESSVPLKTTTTLPDSLQHKTPVPGPRATDNAPSTDKPDPEPAPVPVPAAPTPTPPVRIP